MPPDADDARSRRRNSFALTHGVIAQMLGVRRPSVSVGAALLQRAGLISHQRGVITVVDRPGLESASCECYSVVRSEFDRLLNGDLR